MQIFNNDKYTQTLENSIFPPAYSTFHIGGEMGLVPGNENVVHRKTTRNFLSPSPRSNPLKWLLLL